MHKILDSDNLHIFWQFWEINNLILEKNMSIIYKENIHLVYEIFFAGPTYDLWYVCPDGLSLSRSITKRMWKYKLSYMSNQNYMFVVRIWI